MIETRQMTPAEMAARDRALCAQIFWDPASGLPLKGGAKNAANDRGQRRRTFNPADRMFPEISKAAECMAVHMIEIAAAQDGQCTDADLIRRGWTPDELTCHGEAARQLALGKSGGRA
ncbi:hypothetical protein [Aurantimonas sp. VKM B-3413]|uniref:hypothetical protein n=1 Tax=Aurantimonas sp. VKM B-3413 TaxID=2779401 RepID=UPI001E2BCACB|nr:hypothetical protein [Aurantimonas sp. VKM B-3413]MCB8835966.1 hypothetical protein [Aurantimonas sp. VKM B-3413]